MTWIMTTNNYLIHEQQSPFSVSYLFNNLFRFFRPLTTKRTILYVVTTTPALPRNLSLLSDVKRQICSSRMVDQSLNWKAHWSTETAFVAKQRQLFFIRLAAETPTRDFPAPQGSTIMPDLALPAWSYWSSSELPQVQHLTWSQQNNNDINQKAK